MQIRLKSVVAGAAAIALAGAGIFATATGASALTVGFEPDANSQGSLTFYNAAGNVVTGGASLAHLADFVAASTAPQAGANKASLYFANPDHTKGTLLWNTFLKSGSTAFPVASPASIASITNPVVTLGSGDANLSAALGTIGSANLDTTTGYANLMQVRVYDSGPGVPAAGYWAATIEFNNTSTAFADGLAVGAWQVVGSAAPALRATTITTPVASVPSPTLAGTSLTFSSSVTAASGANPTAGTVKFFDGATQIGATKTYTGGTVTSDATTLTAATHSITAQFIPAAYADLSGNTSGALSYVSQVPPAAATTTTLGAFTGLDGTGTVTQPAAVGGSAVVTKVSDSSVVTAGTVTFYDGANVIAIASASPYTFSVSSTTFTVGTHAAITAVFTPTNPAVFLTSTSAAGTIKVAAPAYTADPQYISTSIPAGTLLISTPYTSGAPLVLAPMTLNAGATLYSTSANFANISVADTRPGNLSYTLSALASNLNKFGVATPGVNESISGENVGLTAITPDSTNVSPSTFLGGVAPGGSTLGQNLTGFDNTAATGVPSNDGGSLGLGGAAPHAVLHANSGLGTTVVHGLLSITAPTNTLDGTYNGTVTFTVIGS